MKKQKLYNCVILLLSITYSLQVDAQVDSLRQVVRGSASANQKIETYPLLIDALIEEGDSVAAISYITDGLALAIEEERKAELRAKEGYLLFRRGHYALSLAIYEQELALSRQEGWDLLASDCLNMLGKIYYNQSSYDTALTYLSESLDIHKALGDQKRIGRSYFDVGRVHLHRGDNQKALDLFEQGLAISKAAGDEKNLIRGYNDIAIVYGGLRDLATASDYFHNALELAEATQILDGLSQTYSNLAVLHNIKRD